MPRTGLRISLDGRVAIVTVDRAKVLNALNTALMEELMHTLTDLGSDAGVGVVVLTGTGEKSFIAGADIKEMAGKTPLEARAYSELGQEIAHKLETMRKPTIAAVNGYALGGGCEIALACDVRLASENAFFGQPEINLGIMPGWGATQRLARATNIGYAKELILTGRMIDAQEALERGLVQHVYPAAELMPKTVELATAMAAKSPIALYYAKEATNRSLHGDIGGNLVHEADLYSLMFSTEDAREGLNAFVEKRRPHVHRKIEGNEPPVKIAVCVKEVPSATSSRRLDPATNRLDRSGDSELNPFDVHALEEAVRIRESGVDVAEIVAVCMGPESASRALTKALALGADRAVLLSDPGAGGLGHLGYRLRPGDCHRRPRTPTWCCWASRRPTPTAT